MQGVDDEVKRYNTILQKFLDAADDEWEPIVAVYRGDLQKGALNCKHHCLHFVLLAWRARRM